MRLHYGAIPEDSSFRPETEGWRNLAFDPDPILMQIIALPIAILLLFIWGILFILVLPINNSILQIITSNNFTVVWLIVLLILIPIHEILHALMHPRWGKSTNTIIGLWLSKGVFYAHYEGVMSRNRFLLVTLAPYLILGLLPLGLLTLPGIVLWSPKVIQILACITLTGSLIACGDIVGLGLILFQIPNVAIVRNKGWKTYWKLPVLLKQKSDE